MPSPEGGREAVATVLLLIGAVIIGLWGLGHLLAARGVVAGFGDLTRENARLVGMAWLLDGVTLVFLAALVVLVVTVLGGTALATRLVVLAVTVLLLVRAWMTTLTGARTSLVPLRLCPVVMIAVSLLFLVAVLAG
jgi:hypothetical protein